MKKNLQHKKGFSLLELLIVISIIAIMITLGISSYSTAQKKGRDSKRKSDLKDVQSALEQYYSVCGNIYPIPTNFYSQGIICNSPTIAILPNLPSDPRGITSYSCSSCNTTSYTLCASLETENVSSFCVSNLQ